MYVPREPAAKQELAIASAAVLLASRGPLRRSAIARLASLALLFCLRLDRRPGRHGRRRVCGEPHRERDRELAEAVEELPAGAVERHDDRARLACGNRESG